MSDNDTEKVILNNYAESFGLTLNKEIGRPPYHK